MMGILFYGRKKRGAGNNQTELPANSGQVIWNAWPAGQSGGSYWLHFRSRWQPFAPAACSNSPRSL